MTTPYPLIVSRDERQAAFGTYNLGAHPFHRNMFQHLLTGPRCRETGGVVLPFQHIYEVVGRNPNSRHARSGDLKNTGDILRAFERGTNLRLNIQPHDRIRGLARVASPQFDPATCALMNRPLRTVPASDRVFFDTGLGVTEQRLRSVIDEYDRSVRMTMETIPTEHPIKPLADHLMRDEAYLCRQVARNWSYVEQAISMMPTTTEGEYQRKTYCERLAWRYEAARLGRHAQRLFAIRYQAALRSPRMFGIGGSILGLPKTFRRLLFADCVEADLKQAQLAIAARKWECGQIIDFLSIDNGDIWQRLATDLDLGTTAEDVARVKGHLKKSLYSVLYGKTDRRIVEELSSELGEYALRFIDHPFIQELFSAREREANTIRQQGYSIDAFGRLIPIHQFERGKAPPQFSVLCQVIQSYELQLMLSLLPILQSSAFRQVYTFAYLFDGLTLKFGDRTKSERQALKLQEAVRSASAAMDLDVHLEIDVIPPAEHQMREIARYGAEGEEDETDPGG